MKLLIAIEILLSLGLTVYADLPCIPKAFNESIVCVCNSTYCDTITREVPTTGTYVKYTSTKLGDRFSKTGGVIDNLDSSYDYDLDINSDLVLELEPDRLYQIIEGFGGAVTDSAGLNLKSLPPAAQQHLINTYFSEHGIEYNMIRLPVGGTDFSTGPWSYNDYPLYDKTLSNFTLMPDDIKYKIPMIHECMKVATDTIEIISASWAPPNWMLEPDLATGARFLKKEYFQTYADYLCKFAQLYSEQGINIWGLTPQNEPATPLFEFISNVTLSWTAPKMATFITENFGPTMRNCSVEGIKLLVNDDQRFALAVWLYGVLSSNIEAYYYIDGIAVHYYADTKVPAAQIARAMTDLPDKFVISTEACTGSLASDYPKVDLGSWTRAQTYIVDILEDLNYNYVGWIDWNMCLDLEGGPTWLDNYVDSPIIVDAENQQFYKQPMYYALGHFSKFLPRGSQRIRAVKLIPAPDPAVDIQDIEALGQSYFDNVAFLTPRGTVVVVLHNDGESKSAVVRIGNQQISTTLDSESITTIEFPYSN